MITEQSFLVSHHIMWHMQHCIPHVQTSSLAASWSCRFTCSLAKQWRICLSHAWLCVLCMTCVCRWSHVIQFWLWLVHACAVSCGVSGIWNPWLCIESAWLYRDEGAANLSYHTHEHTQVGEWLSKSHQILHHQMHTACSNHSFGLWRMVMAFACRLRRLPLRSLKSVKFSLLSSTLSICLVAQERKDRQTSCGSQSMSSRWRE